MKHSCRTQWRGSLCALLLIIMVCVRTFAAPVHDAARKGDLAKLRELIGSDPSVVSSRDKMGKTPLHFAAASNQIEAARFLLDHGADVNARDANGGFRPIDMALSSFHYKEMLDLLLEHGADPNASGDNGVTPLQEAAMRDQVDAIQVLIAKGADPNARESKNGNTALMWALLMGRSKAATALIEANADPNRGNVPGMKPLALARMRGNAQLEKLLLAHGAKS